MRFLLLSLFPQSTRSPIVLVPLPLPSHGPAFPGLLHLNTKMSVHFCASSLLPSPSHTLLLPSLPPPFPVIFSFSPRFLSLLPLSLSLSPSPLFSFMSSLPLYPLSLTLPLLFFPLCPHPSCISSLSLSSLEGDLLTYVAVFLLGMICNCYHYMNVLLWCTWMPYPGPNWKWNITVQLS